MPNPQNPSPPGYLDRTLAALASDAAQTAPIIEHPAAPSPAAPVASFHGDSIPLASVPWATPSADAPPPVAPPRPAPPGFRLLYPPTDAPLAPDARDDALRSLFSRLSFPAPTDAAGVSSALLSLVAAHYAKYHSGDTSPVTPTATWAELGFDSLDRIDIAMAIEDAWGVELPDDVVETVHTVTQAAVWLVAHLAEGADRA